MKWREPVKQIVGGVLFGAVVLGWYAIWRIAS